MRYRDNRLNNINICTSLWAHFCWLWILSLRKKRFSYLHCIVGNDPLGNTTDDKSYIVDVIGSRFEFECVCTEKGGFFEIVASRSLEYCASSRLLLYLKRTFAWPTYGFSTAQPTIYFIFCCSGSKCFLAAEWPFSVRQTQILSCLKSLFLTTVS